jgi:UDP-GlcNAc3NAcA epimerase
MKILTIVGARPQFIKAATVSRAIARHNDSSSLIRIEELIVHTGQHFDAAMSDVFFDELSIPRPSVHLGVGGLDHGAMTGRMLERIERVLVQETPDWVLVYGDTNSTIAGALAAAKLHVPVAHVEAGLRSFNRAMPEEINRVLTDHCASLLLAPTEVAVSHLRREGIPDQSIELVGDVMYDAALFYAADAEQRASLLDSLDIQCSRFALATIHRAENTDDPQRLNTIFGALRRLAQALPVVLPLHPRTRKRLNENGLALANREGVKLIDPVGYLDMVCLERNARLVLTDSGGVQKEAFFYGVPCVTLRHETEWTELIELGVNRLAPPLSVNAIMDVVSSALEAPRPDSSRSSPYGDGRAGEKIVKALLADFTPG